jgi:hypothetical protein
LEVDFVLDGVFFPAGAQEHAAAGFDHAGMSAEVGGGVGGCEIPEFGVFADEVVDTAQFAVPVGIVPGAADGGDIFQPGDFGGNFFEFIAITKFVDVAGAVHAEEAMLAGHGRAALFPILINRADVTDVGSDAGDGGEEEMIFAAAAEVEGEAAFGETAEEERGVFFQFVEERSEFSLGDAFDEEFEDGLVGGGGDGVGAFEALVAGEFDAEGSVLAGEIGEGAAGIDCEDEEVVGDIAAIENACGKKFIRISDQESPRGIGCANWRSVTFGRSGCAARE